MNIPKKIILFALIVIICSRCKQEVNNHNAKLVRQFNTSDTFVKSIDIDDWTVNFLRKAQKNLALDSLNNGFDSIQFRIWNGCAAGYRSGNYWLY
jgi:hypothetical protein